MQRLDSNIYSKGFKYLISLFVLIAIAIFLYIFWYNFIAKNSDEKLTIIGDNLTSNEIIFNWQNKEISGFPFRIEIKLENVELNYLKYFIHFKNIQIIYHPWNLNHILIISKNITISENENNSEIIKNNIDDSKYIFIKNAKSSYSKRNENVRISIITEENNFDLFKFKKSEIHILNQKNSTDAKIAVAIKNIKNTDGIYFYRDIDLINFEGKILEVKKVNLKNINKWINTFGGLELENINIKSNTTNITGNGFIGLDKNYKPMGSFTIQYENASDIFKEFKKNNVLSETIWKALFMAFKASESLAKFNDEIAETSITLQDGYLNIFGIEMLKMKGFEKFFVN